MAKIESTFINMLITLFAVTLFSSSALGVVYEMTKGPKAQADLAKKTEAIRKVVPAFDNNPLDEEYSMNMDGGELHFFPARKDGKLVGTAINTFTQKGYGGTIRLMVGLLPDGTINNIAALELKETPGLGQKIEKSKSDFSLQFNGKNPANFKLSVKQDRGDVDAITAATISSRAFCDAVKRAYDAYIKEKMS